MYLDRIGGLIDGKTGEAFGPPELRRRIAARREAFAKEGLGAGDRVAAAYGNVPEFFVDLLAVWEAGACLIPLDPAMTDLERAGVLAHSGAQALLSPGRAQRLRPSAGGSPGEALILYTSGTTGRPKGVVHTVDSLRAKFEALSGHVRFGEWSRALCLLPTFFGHGLICNSLWPWLTGRDLVICPSNDLEVLARLGELLDRHRVDFMSSVPSVWRWLFHAGVRPPQGGTLKRAHCASAPLDEELWRRACGWAGAPVINALGITETGSWIAGTEPGEAPEDGLVGSGWGCEFEVRDAREGEERAGEIWVKTAALMRGYLDAPELTAAAVKDGWYRTGDLGYVDARGKLHLKARADDVINKAGLKVYPDEVEAVLRGCPQVADACVFREPHAIFGEEVAAAVVLKSGDLAAVEAWCNGKLSSFKLPRTWHRLREIPRNARGKVSRRRVAELCREPGS